MMSLIASDFFAKSPVLVFPIVALILFVTVWTAVTMRTLFRKSQSYERIARLPLDDARLGSDTEADHG